MSAEGLAAHMLGGMGIDLGDAPLDTPLADLHVEGGRGVLQAIIDSVPGGRPTIEDMVRYRAERMRLVGTPEQIADEMERWQAAGIDGINIIKHVIPGSYTEVIEGLLPELVVHPGRPRRAAPPPRGAGRVCVGVRPRVVRRRPDGRADGARAGTLPAPYVAHRRLQA
jgi:hypothetical protein